MIDVIRTTKRLTRCALTVATLVVAVTAGGQTLPAKAQVEKKSAPAASEADWWKTRGHL